MTFLSRIIRARKRRQIQQQLDENAFAREIAMAAIARQVKNHGPRKALQNKLTALTVQRLRLEGML